jgi:hypothetical protein
MPHRSGHRASISAYLAFALVATAAFAAGPRYEGPQSPRHNHPLATKSIPDNWLGGDGLWSSAPSWDNGVPSPDSDVYIATGNDNVLFDVNSTVSSLSIGGETGSSILNDTYGRKLNVFGSLSVHPTGTISLINGGSIVAGSVENQGKINVITSGDRISAVTLSNDSDGQFNLGFGKASFSQVSNYGNLLIHDGLATMSVSGNMDNYATVGMSLNSRLQVAGTFANHAGAIMALDWPGTAVSADTFSNYGTFQSSLGNLATNTLINAGRVELMDESVFKVGTGLASVAGYFQFADGALTEVIGDHYYGRIFTDGAAYLDGKLNIVLDGQYIPQIGDAFRLLSFTPGQLLSQNEMVVDPYFNNGTEMWQLDYDQADGFIVLKAVAAPEPGSIVLMLGGCLTVVGCLRRRIAG